MTSLYKKALLGLLGALLLSAGAVYAEEQAAGAAGAASTPAEHRAGPRPGMAAGMRRPSLEQMKAQMAKRTAALHDKLKITADQEAAWTAFLASMKPPARDAQWKAGDRKAMKAKRDEMAKLSAPERMEKRLDMMKQHQERAGTRLAALKTFYAVLTPEQQKTFNSLHRRHRGGQQFGRGAHGPQQGRPGPRGPRPPQETK